ncbi:MAG TPA: nucleotidyltransferase family protein [Chloroflexota bacterium]|nr:nucleotidyltransferase family protein [Chloroflexota bacterium]
MSKTADRPTLDEIRACRKEILRLAAARGATNVRVFGSVARGDATPQSDVDFLVNFEAGRTLFDVSGLILDLEEMLRRKVDVVPFPGALPSPSARRIAEQIQREAVPL